jgi:hypothetical protein
MNAKEYVTLERRKILHFVVRPTREASQIHLYPCYARLDESRAFSLAARKGQIDVVDNAETSPNLANANL